MAAMRLAASGIRIAANKVPVQHTVCSPATQKIMKIKTGVLTAIAAGAGYLALTYRRRHMPIDLRGKVVLITGASRGLGLAMAREFGERGAIIAICARDSAELEKAQADL